MEIDDLGGRLRARRTAAGRTIASVAADAGLSVPYIANLENGRGNPTLAAVSALARALGAQLRVELADEVDTPTLPASLLDFARTPRFQAEAHELPHLVREKLLTAMAGMGALAARPLDELDWHRILDTVVLLSRPSGPLR